MRELILLGIYTKGLRGIFACTRVLPHILRLIVGSTNIREGKEKEKSDAKDKLNRQILCATDAYKTLIDSNIEESKYTAKLKKSASKIETR